jgi:putative Mn2+ efflux pump MntP
MDTFHTVLVYAGYIAATITLMFSVWVLSAGIKNDDAEDSQRGAKATGWALLLALVSSILDRLIN